MGQKHKELTKFFLSTCATVSEVGELVYVCCVPRGRHRYCTSLGSGVYQRHLSHLHLRGGRENFAGGLNFTVVGGYRRWSEGAITDRGRHGRQTWNGKG